MCVFCLDVTNKCDSSYKLMVLKFADILNFAMCINTRSRYFEFCNVHKHSNSFNFHPFFVVLWRNMEELKSYKQNEKSTDKRLN